MGWQYPKGAGSAGPFSGARIYNSTPQTIHTASGTALSFDSAVYDTGPYASGAHPTRLSFSSIGGGYFEIGAAISWAANTSGYRQMYVLLNGTTVLAAKTQPPPSDASAPTQMTISTDYQMQASDYVEVIVLQTSGGDLAIAASQHVSPEFWCSRLGT